MTVAPRALWLAESLLGVYRVDLQTDRVVARIRIPVNAGSLDSTQIFLGAGKVLVVGTESAGTVLTNRNGLARLDPKSNRVEGVTPLPSGPLAVTFGKGSLWVARFDGSTVERIDPASGKVVDRIHARIGMALAVVGDRLWTASANGTIRQIGNSS